MIRRALVFLVGAAHRAQESGSVPVKLQILRKTWSESFASWGR